MAMVVDRESEQRIRSEINDLRREDRAVRVRQLPWRTAKWLAKLAALVIVLAVVFVAVESLLSFSVTTTTQGTQSSIPRQR